MALAKEVTKAFIVAAKRTPFGTFGGKLAGFTQTDLQEIAARAALEAGNINPENVDSIVVGNVFHSSIDGAYTPRHVGIRLGLKVEAPAHAVNRLCGSGFQSVVTACQEIELGLSNVVLTGGTENMSQAPYVLRNARFGIKLGTDPVLEDALWKGLIDQQIKTPMGVTAENLAVKYDITREDSDTFAVRSQTKWLEAHQNGAFNMEMAPVKIKTRKGEELMDVDEHPKPKATVESMAKLPAVFKKNGTVNAGNASGICDGAGCVVVASEQAVKEQNLTPLAEITGYAISGCDPSIMGIGPVPAIRALLSKTGKSIGDVDLFDINEAFAPQFLACQKDLGLDPEKTNVSGGAIALGHPVGASGSRITAHLAHELRRRNLNRAIGSACIGGGQGIAIMMEKC